MTKNSSVKVTISFNDPTLDGDDLEQQAQNLLAQMKDLSEVETVDRVLAPNQPVGSKSIGSMLVGMVTAEVNIANFKKLMGFLGDLLGNKPIELEVEANGKKLKVKASSQSELTAAINEAQRFISE